jgi:hypothetical protein
MNELEATICRLQAALTLIGNLPLEFNTRARAIAQEVIGEPPPGGWRDHLTPEQIYKVLYRPEFHQDPRKIKPTAIEKERQTMNTTTKTETEQAENPTPYIPPAIEMIPVVSSNVESVGHDGNKTLRMKFKSGVSFFDYVGIPQEKFFDLVNSDSVGKAWKGVVGDVKGVKFELPE